MKNIVLDSGDIINKIKRIYIEIIEKNLKEEEIYIFGVLPNGKYFRLELCYSMLPFYYHIKFVRNRCRIYELECSW